jgi:hypothetical protein
MKRAARLLRDCMRIFQVVLIFMDCNGVVCMDCGTQIAFSDLVICYNSIRRELNWKYAVSNSAA